MEDILNFLDDLKTKTVDSVYKRGENYFYARRAQVLNIIELNIEERDEIIEAGEFEDYRQTIEETIIPRDTYCFSGTVTGREQYEVKLVLTKENILAGTCDCIYHQENGLICKHMVAMAFKIDKNRFFEGMVPKKKKHTLALFETEISNRTVPLKIEVVASINQAYWESIPSLKVSLELQTPNKKYKLDSKLSKFLTAYRLNEEFSFGKYYTYNPKTDYFLDKSKKLLDYLCKYDTLNAELQNSWRSEERGRLYLLEEYTEKIIEFLKEEGKIEVIDRELNELLKIEVLEIGRAHV